MSSLCVGASTVESISLLDPSWQRQLEATVEGRECLRFLSKSKALYPIIGFAAQDHTRDHKQTGLQFTSDGHPLLRVEGALFRWAEFKERFELTPWGSIQSKGSNQVWTYFNSEQGFMPIVRFDWKTATPIHRLTATEYQDLLSHSQGVFPTVDGSKKAILQIVTHHEIDSSRPALWEDATLCPLHTSLRIITEDGNVYSFGVEKDGRFGSKVPIRSDCITAPASLNQLDYDEFRSNKMDQLVTSIPITMDSATHVMEEMAKAQRHVRFTYMHQNCSSIATGFAEMAAGIELPGRRLIPLYILSIIAPDLTKLPVIGYVFKKAIQAISFIFSKIREYTPTLIGRVLCFLVALVLFIPKKITVVFFNTLLLLGGLSHLGELPEELEEESLTSDLLPKNYSHLIRSFWDLFNDDVASVFHSQFLINWQKEQATTRMHIHAHKPYLRIMPELGVRV